MDPKEDRKKFLRAYYFLFVAIILLGLGLLAFQYFYKGPYFLEASTGKDSWPLKEYVATSGFAVVIAGTLVCLLITLLRWRIAEDDDGRRPKFTAGIGILVVGAALMVGAVFGP